MARSQRALVFEVVSKTYAHVSSSSNRRFVILRAESQSESTGLTRFTGKPEKRGHLGGLLILLIL